MSVVTRAKRAKTIQAARASGKVNSGWIVGDRVQVSFPLSKRRDADIECDAYFLGTLVRLRSTSRTRKEYHTWDVLFDGHKEPERIGEGKLERIRFRPIQKTDTLHVNDTVHVLCWGDTFVRGSLFLDPHDPHWFGVDDLWPNMVVELATGKLKRVHYKKVFLEEHTTTKTKD